MYHANLHHTQTAVKVLKTADTDRALQEFQQEVRHACGWGEGGREGACTGKEGISLPLPLRVKRDHLSSTSDSPHGVLMGLPGQSHLVCGVLQVNALC